MACAVAQLLLSRWARYVGHRFGERTLARVREGHRLPAGALESLEGRYDPVGFLASELVLYESVLGRGGPHYEPRLTLELAS